MLRASSRVLLSGEPDDASAIRPPDTAAAANSMATNSRPLPRNAVAKKRSSRSPIRDRTTPMNQRKAMPANGTKFSAMAIAALFSALVSHAPASPAWGGTEILSSTSAEIMSTEKRIPATAAARGVLSGLPLPSGSASGIPSVMASSLGRAAHGYPTEACPLLGRGA
jgi:hypothetical protein